MHASLEGAFEMLKSLIPGLALAVLVTTSSAAGTDAPRAQRISVAAFQRPVHAVLRYDSSSAAACRSFSDTSSEMCLLLALHVIRMSQKPLAGAPL